MWHHIRHVTSQFRRDAVLIALVSGACLLLLAGTCTLKDVERYFEERDKVAYIILRVCHVILISAFFLNIRALFDVVSSHFVKKDLLKSIVGRFRGRS